MPISPGTPWKHSSDTPVCSIEYTITENVIYSTCYDLLILHSLFQSGFVRVPFFRLLWPTVDVLIFKLPQDTIFITPNTSLNTGMVKIQFSLNQAPTLKPYSICFTYSVGNMSTQHLQPVLLGWLLCCHLEAEQQIGLFCWGPHNQCKCFMAVCKKTRATILRHSVWPNDSQLKDDNIY